METLQFSTNLNCGSCVAKVKPFLDGDAHIHHWSVDTTNPQKILTVMGTANPETIKSLVAKSGFAVEKQLSPVKEPPVLENKLVEPAQNLFKTYFPLGLITFYILLVTLLVQWNHGSWASHKFMYDFMSAFFIVFSFFKLLNLQGFKEAYSTYDVVAMKWPVYGYIYPFIELSFGVLYLTRTSIQLTNITMIAVMAIASIGVTKALIQKRAIQCACLGTILNLPMTKISLFEDILMGSMAIFMLFS
jgi:hypothetical protein